MAEWQITWDGHTWSEADFTVGHLMLTLLLLSADTWDFDPSKSPIKLHAVLASFIALAEGRDVTDVAGELGGLSVAKFLDVLTFVEG